MTRNTILFASLILSMAAIAQAQAPLSTAHASQGAMPARDDSATPTTPRSRSTHDGLMLRMSAGFGAFGAAIENSDHPDRGVGGAGPALNVMVGAAVAPNWALHADLQVMGADYARTGAAGQRTKHVSGLGLLAAGVGATYLIQRYDVSLSWSLLYAMLGFDTAGGYSYDSDMAALAKFDVTKEWAISDTWGMGIGLSAFGGYARGVDSEDVESDTTVGGLTLNGVATYF